MITVSFKGSMDGPKFLEAEADITVAVDSVTVGLLKESSGDPYVEVHIPMEELLKALGFFGLLHAKS